VPLDVVPGRSSKLTHEIAHRAVIEVLYLAATGADQVVMVLRALRKPVMKAAVIQEHAANGAHFSKKPYRAEDGGAAGSAAPVYKIVDTKVALLLEDSCQYGAPRRRDPITARLQFQAQRFQIRHDTLSQ